MMVGVTSAQPPRLSQEWLVVAQRALQAEANAIQAAAVRLDGNISEAVRLIVGHAGKIVVTGVGKSGLIGQKLSATLCSTGTPAVFLHAADAVHGDLGVYAPGDPTIMISKSGATAELTRLLPFLRSMRSPLIGILGNLNSPLALAAEVVLDASIDQEADPHNLAPTTSAVVAMALGDALAVALMQARGFSVEEFCLCHPSGQLGRNLALQVRDVMHAWPNVAWVEPAAPMKEVVVAMTRYPLGAACVAAPDGQLAGLITDGDLRRALQIYDDIRPLRAEDIMTRRPVTTDPDAQLCEALRLMENRPSQISVLVVVDPCNGRCLGLLRVHDIYQEPSGQCDRRS